MGRIRRTWQRLHDEHGITMVLSAMLLTTVTSMLAFALDIGRLSLERRRAQNAVDAAALAGAQALPVSRNDAVNAAYLWAAKNGVYSPEIVAISVSSTNVTDDTIIVTARRTVPMVFAPVMGIQNSSATVSAKVTVGSLTGGSGVMPFGILDLNGSGDGFGYTFGQELTLQQPPGKTLGPGNYGLLALDGNGGSTLRETIAAGGSQTIYRVGDQVDTEPGQKTGPVRQGLDVWAQSHGDSIGNSTCNDWDTAHSYAGGKLQVIASCRYRVVLIPIINEWPNGRKAVTILGFAQVYISGQEISGNDPVNAVFLDDNWSHPNAQWGPLNTYGTRITKMTQ